MHQASKLSLLSPPWIQSDACPADPRGKWNPTLAFCTTFLQGCISHLGLLSLRPSLPSGQSGAGRKEQRVRRGRSTAPQSRQRGDQGLASTALMAVCCSPSTRASLHPPSARIFVFPGLTDKAASPLIKRPGEWDQREAGVLRS